MRKFFFVALVLASVSFTGLASPAGAATTNPCKALTTKDLTTVLGTSAKGRANDQGCLWNLKAAAGRPAGTVGTSIVSDGTLTYQLYSRITPTYVAVPEIPNALYSATTSAIYVLKGTVLLKVSGYFVNPTNATTVDVKAQLIQLAKLAVARV